MSKMSPTKKILNSVKGRKVALVAQLINPTKVYYGGGMRYTVKTIEWLAKNTTGRFHIGSSSIHFEKEIDATIFTIGFKI